jgi:hypothetical protein
MTDEQIIELIEKEFKEKTLGTTEQYLEIHSPIYVDKKLKVDRIDRETNDGLIIAYLPILDERFYFSVYINTTLIQITNVGTEAYHEVYFRATSEILTANELQTMTKLTPTGGWNKGDLRKNGRSAYKFSSFEILPNPEPDEFEDKLKKLLDFLEQDNDGIKQLAEKANGYIQVAMDIHNGNGMIGGPNIDKDAIRRMNMLGLSIDFDLYVGGNSFKETNY